MNHATGLEVALRNPMRSVTPRTGGNTDLVRTFVERTARGMLEYSRRLLRYHNTVQELPKETAKMVAQELQNARNNLGEILRMAEAGYWKRAKELADTVVSSWNKVVTRVEKGIETGAQEYRESVKALEEGVGAAAKKLQDIIGTIAKEGRKTFWIAGVLVALVAGTYLVIKTE